jgi:hypothetical protein
MNQPFLLSSCLVLIITFSACGLHATAIDEPTDFQFPADSPVWNVHAYGAKGDGTTDDTQSIQSAISAALNAPGRYGRGGASQIVYFPNGTYKITSTLQNIVNAGTPTWRAGLFIQGQSQAGTILQLPASCPGFTDVNKGHSVIQIRSQDYQRGAVDQSFRQYIRNLTVSVGPGNPGAIGIDFIANNRGGIYDVTVESTDPGHVGYTGITMDAHYPGPALLKNVTIKGFSTGISMRYVSEYGMTFEHITLQDQLTYGMFLGANAMTIRDLKSTNKVPVIFNVRGFVTLLDSTFTGGDPASDAITCKAGQLYCRNVTSTGYGTVINANNGKSIAGNGMTPVNISQYVSSGPFKAFNGNSDMALNLPVKETPGFNTLDMTQWVNAAPEPNLPDYLPSIQAAIDSGKSIVYLPTGTYSISNTIILRGGVKKLIGLCSVILPTHGFPAKAPLIRFDGGTSDFTILQNLCLVGNPIDSHSIIATGVVNNSAKTLVISNCDLSTYDNTATGVGDLFLEDTIGPVLNIDYPQNVWARQLNIEGAPADHITNNGGNLWIFGYKTEGSHPASAGNLHTLIANYGGSIELWGGFFYPTGKYPPQVPMIINKEGSLSANYIKDSLSPLNYPVQVEDTQSGNAIDYPSTNFPSGIACPLYSAHH